MDRVRFQVLRLIPVAVLLLGLLLFFALGWHHYLSFSMLKTHHQALVSWARTHAVLAVLSFMTIYIITVAFSFPGATVLTLSAGFLFGVVWGALWVVIAATFGACVVFLAARYAFADYLSEKAGPWLKKFERGFQDNALSYLLFLRLLPVFPFWLVNIVPGLLNVRFAVYAFSTLIGIIPGSLVYVAVGNGLSSVFERNEAPNLAIVFEPQILIPLILLAALSIMPIAYKRFKRKEGSDENLKG